ncbi:response regulator [Mesobacterium pallidum]|uniref:response regulator n=1 Tax=Mesobacterium pallidum TaxID=2872037 RepID=UPI001EE2F8C6|nr:response regulator transcription factor [Mesobacterium pallidum]
MANSVLIVDDHAFTVAGMQRALEDTGDFTVIGTTGSGVQAIRMARQLKPQIVLLDFGLPDATGIEVAIELARWVPEARVIVVTGRAGHDVARLLRAVGVRGVLSKAAPIEEICAGMQAVMAGQEVIGPQFRLDEAQTGAAQLSPREIEVLMAISRGLTNVQAAEKLGISPKTVDTHRTSLMRKLGANSVATLLVRAAKLGLIDF